jgi:predicted NAD/FAD-binding protein
MPKNKLAWSSWNSISKENLSETCVTYWLNNLQNLKCDDNYFLTLNPIQKIETNKIITKVNFTHPYFNTQTAKLQKELFSLQGKKRTWFCGSYFGYGFHEDGLKSSIEMMKYFD